MCSKKNIITKVYEALLKDKKTFEKLKNELSHNGQLDETFICEHILPLAKKVDPSITWQDILAYEKEALTQPVKISLTDLESVSGGKASNVLLSCGLLALMGFSGLATSSIASADFISFTETKEYTDYQTFKDSLNPGDEEKKKYEFVTLGEVPFYLQADHMVDGLLWFRSPDEDKAFFVMDRKFEDKKAVYTYSADSPSQLNTAEKTIKKPSLKDIQSQEFKLFNINELKGYLQESFLDADKTKFNPITHKDSQTLQLTDDNPLYNFSRFFNPNATFKDRTKTTPGLARPNTDLSYISMNSDTKDSRDKKNTSKKDLVSAGATQTENKEENALHKNQQEESSKKAIASRDSFDTVDWDDDIKKNPDLLDFARTLKDSLKQKISWKIAHRTEIGFADHPGFSKIESYRALKKINPDGMTNSYDVDDNLFRNTGFTFFTLQPDPVKRSKPQNLFNGSTKLAEAIFDFDNIPLVSCSKDLMGLSYHQKKSPCFNGSSEEVKDQITTYYANKEIKNRLVNEAWSVNTFKENQEKLVNEIREQLRVEGLEVRIPTSVAVKDWTILKDGLATEDSLVIKPRIQLGSFSNSDVPIYYPINPVSNPVNLAPSNITIRPNSLFPGPTINLNSPLRPSSQTTPINPSPLQNPINVPFAPNAFISPQKKDITPNIPLHFGTKTSAAPVAKEIATKPASPSTDSTNKLNGSQSATLNQQDDVK